MQIYPNKLANHLKSNLATVYLISGDEALLRADACDLIRSAAKSQQFDTTEKHLQDGKLNWQDFIDSCNAMSLFAEKRFIELRLSSSKIGADGSSALAGLFANFPPDSILMIDAPRIEGKPKWVKLIQDQLVYVPIYPLDDNQLPAWLIQRARQRNLALTPQAASLLAELVTGNLLAAVQELEKLSLLHLDKSSQQSKNLKSKTIDVSDIEKAVASSARFSTFNMIDHAVEGEAKAACRALRFIREEGNEIPAIIGGIAHQLRSLRSLKRYEQQGTLNQGFKTLRTFSKKQPAIRDALIRLSEDDLKHCVQLASRADIMGKSGKTLESWMAIEMILLTLAGKPLPTQAMLIDFDR